MSLLVSEKQYDLEWHLMDNGDHIVTYGLQVKTFDGSRADVEAATEYGLCLRHALSCMGFFDE